MKVSEAIAKLEQEVANAEAFLAKEALIPDSAARRDHAWFEHQARRLAELRALAALDKAISSLVSYGAGALQTTLKAYLLLKEGLESDYPGPPGP